MFLDGSNLEYHTKQVVGYDSLHVSFEFYNSRKFSLCCDVISFSPNLNLVENNASMKFAVSALNPYSVLNASDLGLPPNFMQLEVLFGLYYNKDKKDYYYIASKVLINTIMTHKGRFV